jgi:hypothetical protein
MAQNSLAESFVTLLDWALHWWIAGDDPDLGLLKDLVAQLGPVTRWASAVAMALTVVAFAVLMIVRRRGSDLADLVLTLGRLLLVLSAGWLVFAAGWALSDAVGRWIIGGRPRVGEYVAAVTDALAEAEPALAMTLSVFGMSAVLSFIAVVLARFVLAVLLVAGAPVLAGAAVSRRAVRLRLAGGWLLAVLAFRPLVCVVYRVGHTLVTDSGEPVIVLLSVSLTFLLSAAMLPAVARLGAVS